MGKRGQNEGSIYKREDGRWAGAVTLGWKNGKLQRKTFYGQTRKEVQEKVTTVLRDIQQGLPVSIEKQTVGQFLEDWLENTVKKSVRPRTYQGYEQVVRLHLKPQIGNVSLTKLSPQQVQACLNALEAGGLGARTVAYTRTVLRTALSRAVKWGLIVRNVAALVDPPRYKPKEIQVLSLAEIKIFLKAISGNRLEALYLTALMLGLREGEVLGLRWEDIDFNARTLTVKFAMQRINKKLQLVEPKTEKSRRTLPLPDLLAATLKTHRKYQLADKLLAGKQWNETNLVFTTNTGNPFDGSTIVHRLQKLLVDIGLPKYRFHDLRHSCASLLLSQGLPARTIMEILGHSQINLTLNTYSHVFPEMTRAAADVMDNLLSGKLPNEKTSKQ